MISAHDPLRMSSSDAVMYCVSRYSCATTQLKFFEDTRWTRMKVSMIDEKMINATAIQYNASPEAVKIIINRIEKSNAMISRREIRELTGSPAMPIMMAVCALMRMPVSLRGINPKRVSEKDYGARGKPLHFPKTCEVG